MITIIKIIGVVIVTLLITPIPDIIAVQIMLKRKQKKRDSKDE